MRVPRWAARLFPWIPPSRSRACSRSSEPCAGGGRPNLTPMPDSGPELSLTLHRSVAEIPAADWDACADSKNPFVSHAFLAALEESGSVGGRSGWLPQHAAL